MQPMQPMAPEEPFVMPEEFPQIQPVAESASPAGPPREAVGEPTIGPFTPAPAPTQSDDGPDGDAPPPEHQ